MRTSVDLSSCLVCGSTQTVPDPLGGLLRRCRTCQFASTREPIAAPEELYDDAYFHGAGYEDYLQPDARRYEAGLRLRWLLSTGTSDTLLEAGSAAGFFVEAAQGAGIDAHGVEVSEAFARYAREVVGVPVRQGRFESSTFDAAFDAICAFHILEHVEDPRHFLDIAWQNLKPGGRLLIEVPNIASPAARRLGTSWPGLQTEFHRWHFSPSSLARLVADQRFEIIQQDTAVFRFYMPPRYRHRAGRHLIAPDVRNLRSIRLTHRRRGDLIRLTARRPAVQRKA
jgi:SAM-dependent methyltransferase